VGALAGLKKSAADSAPPAATLSRITEPPSSDGGEPPGPGAGETPLPVETKMRPEPSDMRPPPPSQMPAWVSVRPASSVHSVTAWLEVLTPATYPMYGEKSQYEPNDM